MTTPIGDTASPESITEAGAIMGSTELAYRGVVRSLVTFSERERSRTSTPPARLTMLQVALDLGQRKDIRESTKWVYGSALLWIMRKEPRLREEDLKAYHLLKAMRTREARQASAGTVRAQRKPTAIPEAHWNAILDDLNTRAGGAEWARRTLHLAVATRASGARPCEWMGARWTDESHTAIELPNVKVKADPPRCQTSRGADTARGSEKHDDQAKVCESKSRVVQIPCPFDRLAIDLHMAAFNACVSPELPPAERYKAFRRFYFQCAQVLRVTCRRLWSGKHRYTLSTVRGQFCANMKALHGSVRAAQLMGHSSPRNGSRKYYGKANQAHSSFKGHRPGLQVRQAQGRQAASNHPVPRGPG